MTTLRIAGLQTAGSAGDVDANFAELDRAAAKAAAEGAQLLITPETFLTGYDIGEEVAALAELPLIERSRDLARNQGIGLLVGLPTLEAGKIGNSAVLIDETGRLLSKHVKTHLFGDLDRTRFVPGGEFVTIADFHGVRIASLICYDVEFPENVRAAALAGADFVAVPTANMEPFEFVAEKIIPVRAWENQVYLAYVNRVGSERNTKYVGLSSVVGPDGVPLAMAGQGTEVFFADIDTDVVRAARQANPYLEDRRPQLYG
ncbi:carbon-nitrogen hydrolase family protein [Saxibacter everestensis]|uniref:Carbon-nitrogen hydrolase family protein n=1 Tax=Saxibacter everestensis TaxID=2909229 RepID=A0ABY8QUI7_9MICO|nr:carbon-nitrogen hydrolase family protein [Brevibacteriaceae bacterium ZFBP1038]